MLFEWRLSLVCFVAFSGLFAKRRNTTWVEAIAISLFAIATSFAACRTGLLGWRPKLLVLDAIHRLGRRPSKYTKTIFEVTVLCD